MLSMQDRKVNRNGQLRTLVLFPGSLGDFLCLLPALMELAGSTPDGVVEVVARGELLGMIQRLPFVCQAFSLDSGIFAQLFSPLGASAEQGLRFSFPVSEIFSWFGHAHPEVRMNLNRIAPGRIRSFAFFTGQEDCHASAYYLRCVGTKELRGPSLLLGEEERQWLDRYWRLHDWPPSSRVLIIHPGSGGQKKRWATEGFVQICHWWQQQKKGKVLILLGPAEEEEAESWRQTGGQIERNLSLLQVAALLSRADLYLGNDSGISHLAGAVGVRGVVLFGPTRPQQWRPLGGSLSVLHNAAYRAALSQVSGISLTEIPYEKVLVSLARL
ncbi:MAG TPA: glycosyltransferase family 9 protein [Candidatus Binatia bacterium]|nr:glycosyltransferase family 9 protein [Candidatus Binatia bacterium]